MDLVKVLWDKLSAKYACASAWSAVFPITFWITPHVLAATDPSSVVLKFYNGGYGHLSTPKGRFGKRHLPHASVVCMFVGRPFLAELLDLGGAAGDERAVAAHLGQAFEAAMNTNIWVSCQWGLARRLLTRPPAA